MKDTLVSARIPSYKKEQAQVILESLGATTSDLINSAFNYVIEHRQLPGIKQKKVKMAQKEFQDFIAKTTLDVDWNDHDINDDPYYKKILIDGRVADYEALTRH